MAEDKNFEVRPLTDAETRARNRRNLWLALALVAFVVIVLAITIVRLSGDPSMPDAGF